MDSEAIAIWEKKGRDRVPESLVKAGEELFRRQLIRNIREGRLVNIKEGEYDRSISIMTGALCRSASIFTLDYISKYDQESFQRYFLLQEVIDNRYLHYLAVVQTTDGKWFAYSPANYVSEAKVLSDPTKLNSLTTVFYSETIEGLMDLLKEKLGGIWPAAKDIRDRKNSLEVLGYESYVVNPLLDRDLHDDPRIYDTYNLDIDFEL